MARVDAKRFEEKSFVLSYFEGVETGNDVTQRLQKDNVTISAPDLICYLIQWLAEVDDSDEDSKERTSQELTAMDLDSQQKASQEESSSDEESSASSSEGQSSSGGGGFNFGRSPSR